MTRLAKIRAICGMCLPCFTCLIDRNAYEQFYCTICLEEFEKTKDGRVVARCKHSFDKDCLLKRGQSCFEEETPFTCPICRKRVEKIVDHRTGKSFSFKNLFKKKAVTDSETVTDTEMAPDELRRRCEEERLEVIARHVANPHEKLTVKEFLESPVGPTDPQDVFHALHRVHCY